MGKMGNTQPGAVATELQHLLRDAEKQFPGISDLLQVYGGYEDMILQVQQYLDAAAPEPFVRTTNQSYLEA